MDSHHPFFSHDFMSEKRHMETPSTPPFYPFRNDESFEVDGPMQARRGLSIEDSLAWGEVHPRPRILNPRMTDMMNTYHRQDNGPINVAQPPLFIEPSRTLSQTIPQRPLPQLSDVNIVERAASMSGSIPSEPMQSQAEVEEQEETKENEDDDDAEEDIIVPTEDDDAIVPTEEDDNNDNEECIESGSATRETCPPKLGPQGDFKLDAKGSCSAVKFKRAVFCKNDRTLWHKTFNAENRSTREPAVKINRQDRQQGDVFYVRGGGSFLEANPGHQIFLSLSPDPKARMYPLKRVTRKSMVKEIHNNLSSKGYCYVAAADYLVVSLFSKRILPLFKNSTGYRFDSIVDRNVVSFYRVYVHFRCSGPCQNDHEDCVLSALAFTNNRTASLSRPSLD